MSDWNRVVRAVRMRQLGNLIGAFTLAFAVPSALWFGLTARYGKAALMALLCLALLAILRYDPPIITDIRIEDTEE